MYLFDSQNQLSFEKLQDIARERFGDMVKGVVDISREVIALDAELHADQEAELLQKGSHQKDLWGFNLYPDFSKDDEDFIEFDSMINLRPSQGNHSRSVEDPDIQKRIREIILNIIS